MATATASANMEVSSSLVQSETHYSEAVEQRTVKKKSSRRHKEEGTISVSKSSEKLHKKMKSSAPEVDPACAACGRPVYVMERVKAEKRSWHKECFRCSQCQKQLTVESYESEQTALYCKPHFKQLFGPRPVDEPDDTDAAPKRHQMIICESNPVELPPDVVRASDKCEPGLEELKVDVRARFEVFERGPQPAPPPLDGAVPKERSAALLAKLARFKAKGMDIGVSDEYLNGVPVEDSSSEPEEDDDDEDALLKKSYRHTASKEQPVPFCNMDEVKHKWETGHVDGADRHRTRKQEIQNIRSRLFMGKQAKIKEMYEESVKQSEQSITSAEKISRELELDCEKARSIKHRFETGEVYNDENQPPRNRDIEDTSLFNEGIGKKSRSIFLELDANAKNTPISPPPQEAPKRKEIPFVPKDVVRAEDKVEDVHIETADISDRFKFFETYRPETTRKEFRMTPPRQQRAKSPSPEIYHDPSVVRAGSPAPAEVHLAQERHTASRMIGVFRQMEDSLAEDPPHRGPKPLKRFTPPPPGAFTRDSSSGSEEECDSDEERRRILRHRQSDEALQQAQQLARTKSFRSRFENWSESERVPQSAGPAPLDRQTSEEDGESQLDTAKSLRAKFENMQVQQQSNVTKTVTKVNRFV